MEVYKFNDLYRTKKQRLNNDKVFLKKHMEFSPLITLGQVVATLWKQKKSPRAVLRALAPDRYVSSLDEIQKILEENGIEGIIWDVDNTLMAYHGSEFGGDEKRIFDQLGD